MNQLRLEADEAAAKVEDLQSKIKVLEQENLQKEQEITSLSHKNSVLESEVDKLETQVKELKSAAEDGAQTGTQNETLTRRLQLLEEEAEEADKTLRETNEKYVRIEIHPLPDDETGGPDPPVPLNPFSLRQLRLTCCFSPFTGFARPTSRPATSSARFRPSRTSATSGSPSTRRWPRSTPRYRRVWRSSRPILPTSKLVNRCSRNMVEIPFFTFVHSVTASRISA